MKAFVRPLEEWNCFSDIVTINKREKGLISVTGCIDAQKPHMIYALGQVKKNRIIVTFHEQRAKELFGEYLFFDKTAVYYPAKDILFYQADMQGSILTAERMKALKAIREQESVTVITTFDALMNTQANPERVWDNLLTFHQGDIISLEEVAFALIRMGYEKEYQVQTAGQFALRGGILDIYPLTEENPVRIELWDDEIDTIRIFDIETQKSIESIDSIVVYPACELVLNENEKQVGIAHMMQEAEQVSEKLRGQMKTEEAYRMLSMAKEKAEEWGELFIYAGMDAYLSYFCETKNSLLDYFIPNETELFFDELSRCIERGVQTETEFLESMKHRLEKGYILPTQMKELFTYKEILAKCQQFSTISVNMLDTKSHGFNQRGTFGIQVKSVNAYNKSFELLVNDLKRYKKNKYRVILFQAGEDKLRQQNDHRCGQRRLHEARTAAKTHDGVRPKACRRRQALDLPTLGNDDRTRADKADARNDLCAKSRHIGIKSQLQRQILAGQRGHCRAETDQNMRTEACGTALSLALNTNKTAANDRKDQSDGNRQQIQISGSQKVQSRYHLRFPPPYSSSMLRIASTSAIAVISTVCACFFGNCNVKIARG